MPPRSRSESTQLLQEARAIEMLMAEADVPFERLQDYWTLSTDLVALVLEIEEFTATHTDVDAEDPGLFALRHRLRDVVSRLSEMTLSEPGDLRPSELL